ncbi:APC family permease [Streptomyces katsurahamanus]|uniref:Amino acid permease n=1 Tax=Streptomyces katsurahamanus TaxID=2577098 RepID=A0ABW9NPI0_9ACTN|nr:APC family permease [Streptomyces katsurahamanus]MQS35178.1 amino acid permease [Streptomyces katsurahamanus]
MTTLSTPPSGASGRLPGEDATGRPSGAKAANRPSGEEPSDRPPGEDAASRPPGKETSDRPPGEDASDRPPGVTLAGERHRLTALQGLAALSLDAMASVAYGPEAIVLVLATAGGVGLGYTLPVTLAIAALLVVLVASYRQVIAAFPDGGGSYAVARAHLGRRTGLVAAASLILDYVLNVAVSVTAGVAALTSAFPSLYDHRLPLCLGVLVLVTSVNLRGIVDSAKAFIVPTAVFVGSILTLIAVGLFRDGPVSTETADGHASALGDSATTVGALLLLKAFASGCSALTGVEAVANAVPSFRAPAAKRAQHTEIALGALLGVMLIGLSVLIGRFHLQPVDGVTVLAQLADASLGHNWGFYVVQFATVVLLALAANTSFGGLPVLMSLLARDNFLPHVFRLKADREVHRHGVIALAAVAALLLLFSGGDTNTLVPLFAIGVFVGFTVCQTGMVVHWRQERSAGWRRKAVLNGLGAVLTGVSAVVVTATKFTEGAWLIVLALPALVLLFERVHRAYGRIDERIGLGRVPQAPHRERSLVIVPVSHLSRLTSEAVNAAVSLGDEVRAVTVTHQDAEDRAESRALRRDWELWNPGVELVELNSEHRTIGRPVSEYVRRIYRYHPGTRVTVLIPEVEPERLWQRLLQNQRGAVLAHAVRRDTEAVICRLRFRLADNERASNSRDRR